MALRPPSTLLSGGKTSADSVATFRIASAAFCSVANTGVFSGTGLGSCVSGLLGAGAEPTMEGSGFCGTGWGCSGVSNLLGAVAGPAVELMVEDSDAGALVRSRLRREYALFLAFLK